MQCLDGVPSGVSAKPIGELFLVPGAHALPAATVWSLRLDRAPCVTRPSWRDRTAISCAYGHGH